MANRSQSAVLVRAGGRDCALPAGSVTEILREADAAWTRVPHAPASLLGIGSLRGAMLPVLSLARLLDAEEQASTRAARVVLMDRGAHDHGAQYGLLVDAVSALAETPAEDVLDIDALISRAFASLSRRSSVAARTALPTQAHDHAPVMQDCEVLGLRIAGQEYAWPLEGVVAVMPLPAVMTVPGTDAAMRGVIDLHGAVVPVASLRVLLGVADADGQGERVVVVRLGAALVGLAVDGVSGILRIPIQAVDPVPPILMRGRGETCVVAICRIASGARLVSLLAPDRLFNAETTSRILARTEPGTATESAQSPSSEMQQFVVFRLADELYGLPIGVVREVVRRPEALTRLPRAPDFVAGVMNLRGHVVPVIDQGTRFATRHTPKAARQLVMVVEATGLLAGFVVDAVLEVLNVEPAALLPMPALDAAGPHLFGHAVRDGAGRTVLLIAPEILLEQAEQDLLSAIAAQA